MSRAKATGARTSDAIKRLVKTYEDEQERQEYKPRFSPTAEDKEGNKRRRVSGKSPPPTAKTPEEDPKAGSAATGTGAPKVTLQEIQRAFGVAPATAPKTPVSQDAVMVIASSPEASPVSRVTNKANPVLQEYTDEGENAVVRLYKDGSTEIAQMSDPENSAFRVGVFANGDRVITHSCFGFIFSLFSVIVGL